VDVRTVGREPHASATLEAVPLASVFVDWNLEPLQLAPTIVVALLYYRRCRTLARRGTPVPGWRRGVFWTGIGLVIVALNSPVDQIGERDFFFMHMTQHILIGDLAPLCFAVGLTGPVLRPVLAIHWVERMRFLAHPLVALPVWAVNLYVWHLPFLYDAALRHPTVHALEHTLFFACGTLMWAPVVETLPAPQWFGTGAKLGYIVAVRLVETVLGNIFIWSSHAYYPWYVHARPLWGISAVHDQNLAGAAMMIEGSIVTFVAIVVLFLRMAEESEQRQRLIEQGVDPAQASRAVRYGRGRELQLQVEGGGGDATASLNT
jgi:cytochrome c oxidase assembly factor CtaG